MGQLMDKENHGGGNSREEN